VRFRFLRVLIKVAKVTYLFENQKTVESLKEIIAMVTGNLDNRNNLQEGALASRPREHLYSLRCDNRLLRLPRLSKLMFTTEVTSHEVTETENPRARTLEESF
jgi:hypothetical protein